MDRPRKRFNGFAAINNFSCTNIANSVCAPFAAVAPTNSAQSLDSLIQNYLANDIVPLQCSPPNATRFSLSFSCYAYLSSQPSCPPSSAPNSDTNTQPFRPLCSDACTSFVASVSSLFSNPDVCVQQVPQSVSQARTALIQQYTQTCALALATAATPSDCVPAVQPELQNCGFGNSDASVASATTFCAANQTDTCCSHLITALPVNSPQSTRIDPATPVIQPSSDPVTAQTPPAVENAAPHPSNFALSPFTIASVVAGTLVLVAIVFFYVRPILRKRSARESTQSLKSVEKPQNPSVQISTNNLSIIDPPTRSASLQSPQQTNPFSRSRKGVISISIFGHHPAPALQQSSATESANVNSATPLTTGFKTSPKTPMAPTALNTKNLSNHRKSFNPLSAFEPPSSEAAKVDAFDPSTTFAQPVPIRSQTIQESESENENEESQSDARDTILSIQDQIKRNSRYDSVMSIGTLSTNSMIIFPPRTNDSIFKPTLDTLETMEYYATTVMAPYTAKKSDEMTIDEGDSVRVYRVFADGWGYGKNMSRNDAGVFPVVCLSA